MSIASLFKPVDSSKTRLPRTDVLDRVAKYADGKSVVSNYFDISTDELINMLRKDLVPASEIEYVSDIVRTRLSGETTAVPKKSVGETIKNTAKEFTVSDPTKDFITLEDIIGIPTAPSGFERGNYLESLIGSGTTGGPTQRGSPAKDKDYLDPLNVRPTSLLASKEPSNNPNYQRGTGSDGDFGSGFRSVSKDTQRGTDSEGNFGSGFSTPQSEIDAYNSKILQEKFDKERAGTSGFFSNESNPLAATDQKATSSAMSPPISENFAANMAKRDEAGGFGISDIFKKQGAAGVAKDVGGKAVTVGKDLYDYLSRPVVTDRQEMLTEGKPFETPTSIALGEEGVQQLRKDYYDRERRKAVDPTGISALPSDVGAATDKSGGIVPRGVDPTGIGRDSTPTPAFVAGTDPTRVTSAPSTSSQPSATPPAFRSGLDDKPTKDDKKAIQETATAVAKNPSVGGIQSLFEQAGFSDALLQLGLGMMASKNPDFLGSLGEAGQGAVAVMAKQREAAKKAKEDADKAALEERRVAAYEQSIDQAGGTDKRPAAVQSAELVATSLQTALKQAAAGQFGTTEQIIAQQHAAQTVLPFAERSALQAARSWQSGFNDATTTKQKDAYKATYGASADEASNIAYQKAIDRHKLGKFLTLGEEPIDIKSQYNLQ
tara:strand:- start:17824 stop:19803 length:1980 start_codon:yes stop_codon:yes gene_type:complete